MRIAFLGTPDFAVPSLRALKTAGYELAGVFTQPDRPKGRGKALSEPAVKVCAVELGLDVYQFERIKSAEGVAALKKTAPELMVTAAFGQILSREILEIPPLGCINVHASLLPKYRGAAPIQWAVINGEKVTGVTTMFTDIGLDTGDMLLKKELEILPDETAGELFERLSVLGAEVLLDTLRQLEAGTLKRIKQDEAQASYYPMIKKEDGLLDFNASAGKIVNFVRGMTPWPGAYCFLEGERFKIGKAEESGLERPAGAVKGQVLAADVKNGLVVAAAEGAVRLSRIQFSGQRMMDDIEYLRGHRLETGAVLNSGR